MHRASSVRLVGRLGAITIVRSAGGVVVVELEGRRVEELLPRAGAELSHDLGRLTHLVVDARQAEEEANGLYAPWAEAHRDRASRVTFIPAGALAAGADDDLEPPSRAAHRPRPVVSTHPTVVELRHA